MQNGTADARHPSHTHPGRRRTDRRYRYGHAGHQSDAAGEGADVIGHRQRNYGDGGQAPAFDVETGTVSVGSQQDQRHGSGAVP